MSVLSKSLFVERMLECMVESGVSRDELAERVGVSKATVGRWLTQGKTHQFPTLEQFVEVCDLLGVSQTYITVGVGAMKSSGDGTMRAAYRRYAEDPAFSQLVLLLMELPHEALTPLTEALAAVAHSQPTPPTTD